MAGRSGKVSRIAAAAALVVLVAAGCGGGARPQRSAAHGIPSALAKDWAGQAAAIAATATAGDNCRAQALAVSLRKQVLAQQHRLPLRLRSPLVTGLDSLVARTTCRQTVTVQTTPAPKPPPPGPEPHKPKPHDDHGGHGDHGPHGHGGDGGGNQGGNG